MKIEWDSLIKLRKELHKFPELSGREEMTSGKMTEYLSELEPDELIRNLGGFGLAARFRGGSPGPRIMVRAELDALPIYETNDFEHRSNIPGVSHKCGHDGHMAIMAGVASCFASKRPERGELVVLFQPSEENGEGARRVIDDPLFIPIEPDYVIALHNLPGFEQNEIVLRNGTFAAASIGMVSELNGKTSHAAEPENGISPSAAVSQILMELPLLSEKEVFGDFVLATIIHARIGEIAFGTSPGEAVVMATLRAFEEDDMEVLTDMANRLVSSIALSERLRVRIDWQERFPATINDAGLAGLAGRIAAGAGCSARFIETPFRWSEDFGWFTQKYKGLLFGLGAGKGHPELHNPDYDFPDDLVATGVNMVSSLCNELFLIE